MILRRPEPVAAFRGDAPRVKWRTVNRSRGTSVVRAVDALQGALTVAPAVASDGPQWKEVMACVWRTPRLSSYDLPETDEAIVALHTGGMRSVRARVDGGWSRVGSNPGHVHVIPPRFPTGFKPQGELEFVSVHIGAGRLRGIAEQEGLRELRLPFRFAFHDSFVGACVKALQAEMESPREYGSLYVDSVTDALALHLLRSPAPRTVPRRARETLSRRTLGRVCDRIEASVECGVSLQELAREAGASRFHFARAFREATGIPPHRYLTLRRIERAKDLLLHTDLSLVEVALACGFGNQSHFTLRFRGVVGVTPRRFRLRG
jgi:AraC family transcriptional regulator